MADKFLLFLNEVSTLVDAVNTTTNETSTHAKVPLRKSSLVVHINFFLASLYSVLLAVTVALLIQKIRKYRSLRVGLVYVIYILVMCIIRLIYLVMPNKDWVRVIKYDHGPSYMSFVDLLPELVFVSIFLLTTVMWGIAWARTRRVKIFKEHMVVYIHSGIVLLIMLVSVFLSVAIRENNINYSEVILWEAYYIITLSGVAVIASAVLGGLLFHTFRVNNFQKNTTQTTKRHMRHLLALLVLTTISFVLKGVWNLVIGSIARKNYSAYKMSSSQFGALWFFYYFLTELLPLSLALIQQWRSEIENPDSDSRNSRDSQKDSKNSARRRKKREGEESKESKELSSSMSMKSLVSSDVSVSGTISEVDAVGETNENEQQV